MINELKLALEQQSQSAENAPAAAGQDAVLAEKLKAFEAMLSGAVEAQAEADKKQ